MGKYIKVFDTHLEYESFKQSADYIEPNVSICTQDEDVHYNPYVPPSRVLTAVFHITDTAHPTSITYENGWTDVESVLVTRPNGTTFELSYEDLVEYDSMEGVDPYYGYQFDSTGDYTFEYTLNALTNSDLCPVPYVTSVDIPYWVSRIPDYTFFYCKNLTNVTVRATTPPQVYGDSFWLDSISAIYVPAESVNDYKTAELWSYSSSKIQAIPTT